MFNLIKNVVEVVCMMAFDCHLILVLKVHYVALGKKSQSEGEQSSLTYLLYA